MHCNRCWSPFSLEVEKVFAIEPNPELLQQFQELVGPAVASDPESDMEQPTLQRDTTLSGTRRLYHGTDSIALEGIIKDGFRLPSFWLADVLMFGRGIYFADLPQKAWNFAEECEFECEDDGSHARKKERRYILACDVAIGKTKRLADAMPHGHELIRQPSLGGTAYDSIVGLDESEGGVLSLREFVVLKPEQALPKFLLVVSSTATGCVK